LPSAFIGPKLKMYPKDIQEAKLAITERNEGALRLARKWMFKELHAEFVRKIGDDSLNWECGVSPADRIRMAREHQIPQWLRLVLLELVLREENLSSEELQALGWEASAKVIKLRERRLKESSNFDKVGYSKMMERSIETSFEDELGRIDVDYNNFYASDM
jgi:hypothetical protein